MTRPLLSGRRQDRGSLSLETAILAPVLLGFLMLVVAAGRIHLADNTLDDAARNAARAASLERDAATAQAQGNQAAQQTLQDQGLHCSSLTVDVPGQGFQTAIGTPASVTVTITCQLQLSDLLVPGLPGTKPITASFTSAIDPYRGRPTTP